MAGRVTQDVVEVPLETDNQSVRVTQDVAEVPIETSHQSARVTQDVAEVPIETSNQLERVTQVVVEVLIQNVTVHAPTGCAAFAYFRGCDIVVWWDDDDADGYELERRVEGGIWVPVAALGEDEVVYVDSPTVGLVYQYRVRGLWSGYPSEWCYTNEVYLLCQEWEPGTLEANYSIVIRGTDGEQIGIIDAYEGFEYTRVLNDAGYLEITAAPELVDPDWFELDYIIEVWRKAPEEPWREDFTSFHRFKRFWYDNDDQEWFRSVGPGVTELLKRRIILPPSGEAALEIEDEQTDIMRQLVRTQMGPHALPERQMPGLSVELDSDDGEVLRYLFRYEDLFEVIAELSTNTGADFAIEHLGTNLFEFRVYPDKYGVDRRVGNVYGNAPFVFSIEMANMTEPEFESDRLNEKTVVYVAGEEAGALREIVERGSLVGAEYDSPWNRVESFIESRQEVSLGTLMAYGDAFLVEAREQITFTCEATPTQASLYSIHWDLGDLVTGRYRGVDYDMQIVEIQVVVDADGEHIRPTFEVIGPVYSGEIYGPIYEAPYFA